MPACDLAQVLGACPLGGEPSLLAEIEYRGKSAQGKVRHPFFKGIREDI